jgi:hypothetical protein
MGTGLLARHQRWRVEVIGFAAALVLPLALWHHTIAQIAGGFRFQLGYLVTGWAPWVLMGLGLACFVPILREELRDPQRRFYGSPKMAWFGWSTTLYLLGFGLATQVAQIADGISAM